MRTAHSHPAVTSEELIRWIRIQITEDGTFGGCGHHYDSERAEGWTSKLQARINIPVGRDLNGAQLPQPIG